jgi:hypothetical protein
MMRRRWLRCITLALVLTATACAGGASRPDTAGSTVPQASATKPPTEPSAEPAGEPSTEGTGSESPQSPHNAPSVTVTSPSLRSLIAGGLPSFTDSRQTLCSEYENSFSVFKEDVAVAEVIISPEGAFVRDDAACAGNKRPLCFDFVFPAGQADSCFVGIRWRPEMGVTMGNVTLRLTAHCESRADELCEQLEDPLPPGGTNVEALNSRDLKAILPEGGTQSTSAPRPDPGIGPFSAESSPAAGPFASPAS